MRKVHVGTKVQPRHPAEGHPVHIVERHAAIAGPVAASEFGINRDLLHQVHAHSAAEALKQILIQQTRSHQDGIERGNIPEVGVVEVQLQALHRAPAHGEKAATDPRPGCGHRGVTRGAIGLQRAVDGKIVPVGNRIFKEKKRPIDGPTQQADPRPAGARIVQGVKAPPAEVHKSPANLAVGTVVPGGRVRRGAYKNPRNHPGMDAASQIAPVDGVQAVGPRQVQPPEPRHPAPGGIVIDQTQVIGAVDQLLQRSLRGRRGRVDGPAIVSLKVPVAPPDACEVRTQDHAQIPPVSLGGVQAVRAEVIETQASLHAVDRGQRRTRYILHAGLGIECVIAFGEADHRRILPRGTQRVLLHQRLQIAIGKISQISGHDRALQHMDFGDRGGLGDTHHRQFGYHSSRGRAARRRSRGLGIHHHQLHTLGNPLVSSRINVSGILLHEFHVEKRPEIGIRNCRPSSQLGGCARRSRARWRNTGAGRFWPRRVRGIQGRHQLAGSSPNHRQWLVRRLCGRDADKPSRIPLLVFHRNVPERL